MVSSDESPTPPEGAAGSEKAVESQEIETIHTNERVAGHHGYYEKNGLRTYGDGLDHEAEPRVCQDHARGKQRTRRIIELTDHCR